MSEVVRGPRKGNTGCVASTIDCLMGRSVRYRPALSVEWAGLEDSRIRGFSIPFAASTTIRPDTRSMVPSGRLPDARYPLLLAVDIELGHDGLRAQHSACRKRVFHVNDGLVPCLGGAQ